LALNQACLPIPA